jgi:predicted secreted protein
MMRGGSVPALQKILGHASLAMTMRYAHLSPEHLRGEMAKTERSAGVEPDAGTRAGQSGQNVPEVVESTDERRGSSVAEQLIRKPRQPDPAFLRFFATLRVTSRPADSFVS